MMPDMNDRLSKLVLAGAVAVAALGFAGCSAEVSVGDKTIDSADLEGQLADQLSSQAGFKASQVSVDCPERPEGREGHRVHLQPDDPRRRRHRQRDPDRRQRQLRRHVAKK